MKILVIANPHAGSGTTRRRIHGLMTELRRRAEQVRVEWTMAPGSSRNGVQEIMMLYLRQVETARSMKSSAACWRQESMYLLPWLRTAPVTTTRGLSGCRLVRHR